MCPRRLAILAGALGLAVLFAIPRPARAQTQFSQAQAQAIINTRDWNRLLAYGKAWAQAEPNNSDAWFVIGRAYGSKYYHIGLERPADAALAFQRLVQVKPRWPDGWNALGITLQETGQWKESAVALEHATQLAPERTRYWDFLCISYLHTHQFQQAAGAASSLERSARNANDWFMAGSDYYAIAPYYEPSPMYQKAKADFQRVVQLEPRNGAGWTNLGTTEQALGNTQTAFADYQKGAQLGNGQGASNYQNLAADIQACMIQRQGFNSGIHNGMEITSYNARCARYTGEIKVIYVP